MSLRENANKIMNAALAAALPDAAVQAALEKAQFSDGKVILIAAGKAGWQMAKAAHDQMGDRIHGGVVVTKYDHSKGPIANLDIYEAGHPVPDANSFRGTQAAIDAVTGLSENDTVLFLLSGGGSALFEKPLIPEEDLNRLTKQLLACGADIVEMNTVRKRFSAVKGGRFAQLCQPAKVFTIVLSDVLGDRLDMIASGPAYPDSSTTEDAKRIVQKYNLTLTGDMESLLLAETPKELGNVETHITGSVRQLCISAEKTCRELGYEPVTLTDRLCCTARDAGVFLSNIARYYGDSGKKLAFLVGGETVVHLTGHGLGGRNQELALAAADGIAGMNACVFSVGSDGTDGPTDAAGGYVDGTTAATLKAQGILISDVLQDNDAYHALQKCDGLIITGATGTNVNDISVLLIGE
ncbi:MAG: glycerate kinase [Oscillospiraceae bacterium]|nr:glycerate kinase [Oscillospiraceae bacterium]